MIVENDPSGTGASRKIRPGKRPLLEWIGSDLAGASGRGVVSFGVISALFYVFCFITQLVMENAGLEPFSSAGIGGICPIVMVEQALAGMLTTAFLVSLVAYIVRTSFMRRVTDQIGARHGLSYFVAGSVFMVVGTIPYGVAVSFLGIVVAVPVWFAGALCLAVGYRVLWQRACDARQGTSQREGQWDGFFLTGHDRVSRGVEQALTGQRPWGPFLFLVLAVLTLPPDYTETLHVFLAPNWPAACLIVAHTGLDVLFEVSFLAWLVRRTASGAMMGRAGRISGTVFLLGGVVLQGVGVFPITAINKDHHLIPLSVFCLDKGFVFLPRVLIALGWMVLARHAAREAETAR